MKKQTIAVIATKGGTGKTTTAGALAMAAKAAGRRVLCVDLDPQSNLSMWLDADLTHPGAYQLITENGEGQQYTDPAATVQAAAGLGLICGNADLMAVKTYPGSAQRLKAALTGLQRQYDLTVIDTGPALGELQNLALMAATGAIIPLQADSYSLQALYQADNVLDHIRESNTKLKALGVILTQYDGRSNVAKYLKETIESAAAERSIPFLGTVRKSVVVQEAQAMQQNLLEYAPKSKPVKDYLAIFEKLEGTK